MNPLRWSRGAAAFLIATPLAWAAQLLFHPLGSGQTYDVLRDQATRWQTVHTRISVLHRPRALPSSCSCATFRPAARLAGSAAGHLRGVRRGQKAEPAYRRDLAQPRRAPRQARRGIGRHGEPAWIPSRATVEQMVDSTGLGDIRIDVVPQSGKPVFAGIARTDEVSAYLRDVAHTDGHRSRLRTIRGELQRAGRAGHAGCARGGADLGSVKPGCRAADPHLGYRGRRLVDGRHERRRHVRRTGRHQRRGEGPVPERDRLERPRRRSDPAHRRGRTTRCARGHALAPLHAHHRHGRDWEGWTDMAFPEPGSYVFPTASAPLEVARRRTSAATGSPMSGWSIRTSPD